MPIRIQYRLKEDLIIPKGTVLSNIDGQVTTFIEGCYGENVELDNDNTVFLSIMQDYIDYNPNKFEVIVS